MFLTRRASRRTRNWRRGSSSRAAFPGPCSCETHARVHFWCSPPKIGRGGGGQDERARSTGSHDCRVRRTHSIYGALRHALLCVRICLAILAGLSCRTRARARGGRVRAGCGNCTATCMWSNCRASGGSSPGLSSRNCCLCRSGRKRRAPVPDSPWVLDGDGRQPASGGGARPSRSARRCPFTRPCSTAAKYGRI